MFGKVYQVTKQTGSGPVVNIFPKGCTYGQATWYLQDAESVARIIRRVYNKTATTLDVSGMSAGSERDDYYKIVDYTP